MGIWRWQVHKRCRRRTLQSGHTSLAAGLPRCKHVQDLSQGILFKIMLEQLLENSCRATVRA